MALFSRAFIRKRVISLATTTSLAATSFALAHDPTTTSHLRGALPIQYAADNPDHSNEQSFLSENEAAMKRGGRFATEAGDPRNVVDRIARDGEDIADEFWWHLPFLDNLIFTQ